MKHPLVYRLVLAMGSGLLITGLCLDTVSKGAATFYARYPQKRTRQIFQKTTESIAQYQRKNGQLPHSIVDLELDWNDTPHQERQLFDGWHRPLIYQVQGAKFQLISYGEDGKPGGKGLNCDLTSDNPNPAQAGLSRLENLRHPLSQGMNTTALICGVLVAITTFQAFTNKAFERRNWLVTIAGLALTLAAASVVSIFITLMHVPSGH